MYLFILIFHFICRPFFTYREKTPHINHIAMTQQLWAALLFTVYIGSCLLKHPNQNRHYEVIDKLFIDAQNAQNTQDTRVKIYSQYSLNLACCKSKFQLVPFD